MRLCIFITSRNQQLPATARPPLFCAWLHPRASTLPARTARYSTAIITTSTGPLRDSPAPSQGPSLVFVNSFNLSIAVLQAWHVAQAGPVCFSRSFLRPNPIPPYIRYHRHTKKDKRPPSHTEAKTVKRGFRQKKPCYAS